MMVNFKLNRAEDRISLYRYLESTHNIVCWGDNIVYPGSLLGPLVKTTWKYSASRLDTGSAMK